jgi:hypothetical protein
MKAGFVQFGKQLHNMQAWFEHYGKKLPKNEKAMRDSVRKIEKSLSAAAVEILNLACCEERKEADNGTV